MLKTATGVKFKEVARKAASVAASETEGEEEGVRKKDEKREMTHTHVVEATNRRDLNMFDL